MKNKFREQMEKKNVAQPHLHSETQWSIPDTLRNNYSKETALMQHLL